jgi:hypothetical protein
VCVAHCTAARSWAIWHCCDDETAPIELCGRATTLPPPQGPRPSLINSKHTSASTGPAPSILAPQPFSPPPFKTRGTAVHCTTMQARTRSKTPITCC